MQINFYWRILYINTKKKIVILLCDDCGKENRIKESNLWEKDIRDLDNNYGCYCYKCSKNYINKPEYSKGIYVGETFKVFPKIIDRENILIARWQKTLKSGKKEDS